MEQKTRAAIFQLKLKYDKGNNKSLFSQETQGPLIH